MAPAKLQAVYVEDDDKQFTKFGRILESLLHASAYDLDLRRFKTRHEVRTFLKEHRPHVVIVDNKLSSADEFEGLRIISEAKPEHPDTVFCLLSREKIEIRQFGLRTPNPDLIVSKVFLGAKEDGYRTYVRDIVLKSIHRSFIEDIEWMGAFDEIFRMLKAKDAERRPISPHEVKSILEQVTFAGDITSPANQYDRMKVWPMPGGYSGAVVLKFVLQRGRIDRVFGVLKLSPIESAEQELLNYNRYVKWTLPYTWRVELLGTARTEKFGGMCYSFVFDGQGEPRAATEYFREGDSSVIEAMQETVFNSEKKTWYSDVRATGQDASEYFSSPPFFREAKQVEAREKALTERLSNAFPAEIVSLEEAALKVGEIEVPRPSHLIFTNTLGEVTECICHGDLNGNNVMFEKNSGALSFIDFQSTGYHNIFRDFVSFESSVRLDWRECPNEPNSLRDYVAFEQALITRASASVLPEYVTQCGQVRHAAFANFERSDLYVVAALIHFWWLAVRFDDWTPHAYRRLLGCVVASLKHLANSARG